MNTASAEALDRALRIANAEDSISEVKAVVAGSLSKADPSAKLIRTSYFNHTFVPDIVIEWPSRGVGQNREVFLRSTVDPRRIEIDVEAHAAQHPMFVHLSAFERTPSERRSEQDRYGAVEA